MIRFRRLGWIDKMQGRARAVDSGLIEKCIGNNKELEIMGVMSGVKKRIKEGGVVRKKRIFGEG